MPFAVALVLLMAYPVFLLVRIRAGRRLIESWAEENGFRVSDATVQWIYHDMNNRWRPGVLAYRVRLVTNDDEETMCRIAFGHIVWSVIRADQMDVVWGG